MAALVHPSLSIFGPSTTVTNVSGQYVLTITLSELEGNITDATDLSPEGLVGAIIQTIYNRQGTNVNRIVTITKGPTIINEVNEQSETVNSEQYTIKIYDNTHTPTLDPDLV